MGRHCRATFGDILRSHQTFTRNARISTVEISEPKKEVSVNLLWKYEPNASEVVSISQDGSHLAVGSQKNVSLFDGRGISLWEYDIGSAAKRIAVSVNGNYVIAGAADGKAYLFGKEGKLSEKYKIDESIEGISISADGSRVVVWTADKNVYLLKNENALPLMANTSRQGHGTRRSTFLTEKATCSGSTKPATGFVRFLFLRMVATWLQVRRINIFTSLIETAICCGSLIRQT